MHAFMAAVLLGMARLDALDGNPEPHPPNGASAPVEKTCGGGPGWVGPVVIPSRSHQTASLLKLKRPLGEAKGTPLSERMAWGRPRSLNKRSKAVKAPCSLIDSMASQSKR